MKKWSDGSVLVLEDREGNQLRILVQDKKLHIKSQGIVIDTNSLRDLIKELKEGYEVLTTD